MKWIKKFKRFQAIIEDYPEKISESKKSYRDIDAVRNYIYDICGDEYLVLGGDPVNSKSKIEMYHTKCDHVWLVQVGSFINDGRRCPNCFGTKKQSIEDLKRRCAQIHGNFYNIIDATGYKNNKSIIIVKHEICGYEYKVSVQNFLNKKSKCPKCSGKVKLTIEEIKKRCHSIYSDDYTPIIDQIPVNGRSKIKMRHNVCGNEWIASVSNIIYQNTGCPFCKMSRGERDIKKYLELNNIEHRIEYRFKECRYIRPLPFDFYLPKHNICIEYDGVQHFKSIDFFGGDVSLIRNKKVDQIKSEFCSKNKILLLRIKYEDRSKINLILDEVLKNKDFTHLDESLSISDDILISSINGEEVDIFDTLKLPKDRFVKKINIDYLHNNVEFINSLVSIGLKKSEMNKSDDYECFLNKPCKWMFLYNYDSNELENPEFIIFQTWNETLTKWDDAKLYKVNDSVKKFYDKLTSRTIEIIDGDQNYIYSTSNGNDWNLQNVDKQNDTYQKSLRKEDLQKLLDDKKVTLNII